MPEPGVAAPWKIAGGLFQDQRLTEAGFAHGVTTRELGDMKEAASRRRALARGGLEGRPCHTWRQVHGVGIGVWHESQPEPPEGGSEGLDGWILARRGPVVGVFVADCVPLFLWSRRAKLAGVFHVGWRGASRGMPRVAARTFADAFGVEAADLEASIGPHVGPCCYSVGPEVAGLFDPGSVKPAPGGGAGSMLDLAAEARLQLAEAGVPAAAIAASGECTACRPDLFFSWRRDGRKDSLMAFVAARP